MNDANDAQTQDLAYARSTADKFYEYNPDGDDYIQHRKAPVGSKWVLYEPRHGYQFKVIEIVAIKSVTVPYRTFDTAYKHRRYRCNDPDDLEQGKSEEWFDWIVPGIGMVKMEDHWADPAEAPVILELVNITGGG